ncbi:hypothetical protein M419DRAFT_118448 [Trichoderma reesei RUT C-30]|jgi:hypothetical protein|uniref:Uncharacterized protein n=1 Tax=Hypocrea jecorina (strain ATCC 56765 / BCRC 32924 / NRRL 11460 / Rut C-30) TaxID=1344414 RepID=A0A024SF09_HYPJR|nr:hypothetical protein M419DRAFT_118448 [Trichoderma reesei RUT C-30]
MWVPLCALQCTHYSLALGNSKRTVALDVPVRDVAMVTLQQLELEQGAVKQPL